MKTIIEKSSEIDRRTAQRIEELLCESEAPVLLIEPNRQLVGVVNALPEGAIPWEKLTVFFAYALPEYPEEEQSFAALLTEKGVSRENIIFPNPENKEHYDRLIEERGGLSLAVVSVGTNGRTALIEPGTPYSSVTHSRRLTRATRRDLGMDVSIDVNALTVGIQTIVRAPYVIVSVRGEDYAKAVFKMLYARDDSFIPSAFLQLPRNVEVYLDEQAAAEL